MIDEANGDGTGSPIHKIRTISRGEVVPYDDSTDAVVARLKARPVVVHLYTDGPDRIFDPQRLANYLGNSFGPNFHIENHGDIVQMALSSGEREPIIRSLAEAKLARMGTGQFSAPAPIQDRILLENEVISREPNFPIRPFLKGQRLAGSYQLSGNTFYDISALNDVYYRMLPDDLKSSQDIRQTTLVITGRGVGQMERNLIHMRSGGSAGNIALISTTGLVDAPGKPIELITARHNQLGGFPNFGISEYDEVLIKAVQEKGLSLEVVDGVINELFKDRMLSHEDPRINEAIKGMALSFVLYALGEHGKVFQCSTTDLSVGSPDLSKFCRLHDSHWQEELIATQVKNPGQPEFCDYHTELFDKLGKT